MSAAPSTDVIEWEMSVGELQEVRAHLPGLVLPSFVRAGDGGDDAVAALVSRGVLERTPAPDAESWAEDLAAPFLLSLALQNAGSIVIQVTAWTPGETAAHSTVIQASAASHLTVHGDGSARLRGTTLNQAWSTLADLVPSVVVDDPPQGAVTVSTVASQALVDVIGQRDPRLLDAVVRELHVPVEAVDLFRGLADPVHSGFRVKAFTLDHGPVFAGNWFGTTRGWLRMGVGLEADARRAEVTPELITDAGTVTVTAQTDEDIRTELLNLVAGLIRDRDSDV